MKKLGPIFVFALLLVLVAVPASYAAAPIPAEADASVMIEPAIEYNGPIEQPEFGPLSGGGARHHRVRYGETLFSIGRRYGVNPYRIADVNGLYDPNHIYAGQVLYIPSSDGYGRGRSGCDYGCGNRHNSRSRWNDCHSGCGNNRYNSGSRWNNCRSGCGNNRYNSGSRWNNCRSGCGNNRYNSGSRWNNCNSGCDRDGRQSKSIQGYGYDYAGYYYYSRYPDNRRYSYTCGYYYNCF